MKRIVFRVLFSVLIIAAIFGVTSGVALAAGPDNSLLSIVQKIWAEISFATTELEAIGTEVANLQTDVTAIKNGMITVESGSLSENYDYFYDPTYEAEREFTFDAVRHVTITVHTYHGSTPQVWVGFSDADNSFQVDSISYYDQGDDTTTTYEFDASYFRIWSFTLYPGTAIMDINYTFTY